MNKPDYSEKPLNDLMNMLYFSASKGMFLALLEGLEKIIANSNIADQEIVEKFQQLRSISRKITYDPKRTYESPAKYLEEKKNEE